MAITKLFPALLTLTISLVLTGITQVHAADQPLLIPGKESLYQRVLAVPGAQLHSAPGGAATEPAIPFTAVYVYARETVDGSPWLQVGTDRHGGTRGWLKKSLDRMGAGSDRRFSRSSRT